MVGAGRVVGAALTTGLVVLAGGALSRSLEFPLRPAGDVSAMPERCSASVAGSEGQRARAGPRAVGARGGEVEIEVGGLGPWTEATGSLVAPAEGAGQPLDVERVRWLEAERLGIVEEIARSRTGLGPDHEYRLAAIIVREARRHGLDPRLVAAVIRIESGFDADARSHKGALGLMQIMPATGDWLARRERTPLASPQALLDYERNIGLGAGYLAWLLGRFEGRIDQALLAYNAGPSAARRLLADDRDAGRRLAGYPRKVLDEYARISGAEVRTAHLGPADATPPGWPGPPRSVAP